MNMPIPESQLETWSHQGAITLPGGRLVGNGSLGPGMAPGYNYEARAALKENGVIQTYSNVVTF